MSKEIEVVIKTDGTVEFDQIGYEGDECKGSIDNLFAAIGKVVKSGEKAEFYSEKHVQVHQRSD